MTILLLQPARDEIPEGTEWPGPATLVLLHRGLRPDTDQAGLSRFGEDCWDLNPAIFEDHMDSVSANFDRLPAALRDTAKHYLWQLLNNTELGRRREVAGRIAVLTVAHAIQGLGDFLWWLDARGLRALCQVTNDLLDGYLSDLIEEINEGGTVEAGYRRVAEVRRLWAHREILPEAIRLPAAPPWGGEETSGLLGHRLRQRGNRTRRISEATMQMLLCWAIRFVEDFAEDILSAYGEYLELRDRMPEQRRELGIQSGPDQPRHTRGQLAEKAAAYLEDLRRRGEPLPGSRRRNGELGISWRHVAAILDCSYSVKTTGTGRMLAKSGLPVREHGVYLGTLNGRLDGRAWRGERIHFDDAPTLARLLATACFVIVAYLSGARPGEVLNLRRGCITRDAVSGLWLMEGLYFKGAEDENGNKLPEGEVRHDPWVVIELVAQAVEVIERLHPRPLIFPRSLEPRVKAYAGQKRRGQARTGSALIIDLAAFTAWVNAYCAGHGRTDTIPEDKDGPLTPSRFRRTLAWFIRRRPRGLIAAAIQYGHAHTRMTQGYAGDFDSGFPDEYAFEDWLYRLETLAEDERNLAAGEHVSGPAADAYRQRVAAANREFAGRVLTTDRQARDLMGNPLLQIHHGQGMTCVLNPATAACQLRGTAGDPMLTPDLDDCRPKCPNLARTDRDIDFTRRRATELAEIVDEPLAPTLRHARDRHELERLNEVIAAHENGTARP
jgi:hypothetical protein